MDWQPAGVSPHVWRSSNRHPLRCGLLLAYDVRRLVSYGLWHYDDSLADKYWQFILAQSSAQEVGWDLSLSAPSQLLVPGSSSVAAWPSAWAVPVPRLTASSFRSHFVTSIPEIGFRRAVRVMGFIVWVCSSYHWPSRKQRLPRTNVAFSLTSESLAQIEFGLYWLSIFLASPWLLHLLHFHRVPAVAVDLNTNGVPALLHPGDCQRSQQSGTNLPNYAADLIGPLTFRPLPPPSRALWFWSGFLRTP